MTNDTRPTVPPISGHYAMLRNGNVFRHFSPCEYNPEIYRTPMVYNSFWDLNGRAFVEHRPNKKEPWPHADIIATISPESMLATANGSLEILEAELGQCRQDNGDWTYENQLLKAKVAELIKLASAACDYADSHCRAFPIATAPRDGWFLAWDSVEKEWDEITADGLDHPKCNYTQWRPLPPTNPPLPAVFVELGHALEKIKEGR